VDEMKIDKQILQLQNEQKRYNDLQQKLKWLMKEIASEGLPFSIDQASADELGEAAEKLRSLCYECSCSFEAHIDDLINEENAKHDQGE
jgi:hypothetical protein